MFLLQKSVTLFEFHLQLDMLISFENIILHDCFSNPKDHRNMLFSYKAKISCKLGTCLRAKCSQLLHREKGIERSAENTALGQNQKRGRH